MIELKVYLETALIQRATLTKSRITIGRSGGNDVVLSNPHVSRLEAIIQQDHDKVVIFDKSKNGILLDSQRISESSVLPAKCQLDIYPFTIECLSHSDDPTAPIPSSTELSSSPQTFLTTPESQGILSTVHFTGFVGESDSMQQLYQLIQDVGDSPATVLIQGEHGTGKELAACAIHDVSSRRNDVFVPVNCAAIPPDLIESELFGYEKGAFTGAQSSKLGKIEAANNGTLFLDEVGELSLSAQAKLLRFLQEKAIMKVGSFKEVPVDVRVIAATNRDLAKAANEGEFRSDLYYRLKVVQVSLPPLRQRLEDIPLLTNHFIKKIAKELDLNYEPVISNDALQLLKTSSWPGNVRQLENCLYSSILRSRKTKIIDNAILLEDTANWKTDLVNSVDVAPLDKINKEALLEILIQQQWDTSKTAEILKVSRGTIYYKMKKYGIDPPRQSPRTYS